MPWSEGGVQSAQDCWPGCLELVGRACSPIVLTCLPESCVATLVEALWIHTGLPLENASYRHHSSTQGELVASGMPWWSSGCCM